MDNYMKTQNTNINETLSTELKEASKVAVEAPVEPNEDLIPESRRIVVEGRKADISLGHG